MTGILWPVDQARPQSRWAVPMLVLLVTAGRMLVAGGAGLGDAEAYYWTWSAHLDLGYYDHGPLVAWLIRAGTVVLGQTSLGVRAPFVLLSGLLLWLMASIASRLGDGRAGLWAVLGLLSIPAFVVAGAAANPDVVLMALVALFIALALRWPAPTLAQLGLLGLLAGLSVCAKLQGLGLLVPLALLARRRRAAGLAVGLGTLLLGAAPVLVWNWQHDWAALAYHLVRRHLGQPVGFSLLNLAKLVGGQLAYVSPPMVVGFAAAAVALWRQRTLPSSRLLLWTAATLCGAGYLLILLVPGAEPHWAVVGYLALLPPLAARICTWAASRRWLRILVAAHLAVALLVALALHLHVLTDLGVRLAAGAPWYQARYDLSNELRGWDQVARAVESALPEGPVMVGGCHYTSCAQLAFAARGRFQVRCPSPRIDQFDFFPGGDGSSPRGLDLLYVRDERFPFDAHQLYRCRVVEPLRRVVLRRGGVAMRRFDLQLCRGFSGLASDRWPPLPSPTRSTAHGADPPAVDQQAGDEHGGQDQPSLPDV